MDTGRHLVDILPPGALGADSAQFYFVQRDAELFVNLQCVQNSFLTFMQGNGRRHRGTYLPSILLPLVG